MSYVCQPGDKADLFAAAAAEVVRDCLADPLLAGLTRTEIILQARDALRSKVVSYSHRFDQVLREHAPKFWDELPTIEENRAYFTFLDGKRSPNFLETRDAGMPITERFVPVVILIETVNTLVFDMLEMPFFLNEFAPRYRDIVMA